MLKEAIEHFHFEQEIGGYSKNYIKQTKWRLDKFYYFCKNKDLLKVESLNELHIKLFIKKLLDEGTRKNITINNILATIKVFTKFLVETEYLNHDIAINVKNLKEEKTVVTTFNDAEVKRMLEHANGTTYSNVRDKTILIFLLETGIRASELCNIKNEDIYRDRIFINGKGRIERFVYITKKMYRQMKLYEKRKKMKFKDFDEYYLTEHYFVNQSGDPLTRSGLHKIMRKIGEKSKVRKSVRCSPHDCRHYFAQKQLSNGLDVYTLSQLLGHTSVEITQMYLKGLNVDDIIKRGRETSPLSNI